MIDQSGRPTDAQLEAWLAFLEQSKGSVTAEHVLMKQFGPTIIRDLLATRKALRAAHDYIERCGPTTIEGTLIANGDEVLKAIEAALPPDKEE